MKSIKKLIGSLLLLSLLCCSDNHSPLSAPELNDNEIRYQNSTLYSSNALIRFEGKDYSNQAKIPEGKLVGVVLGGRTYLFFTGIKDTTLYLNHSLSVKSLATFIASGFKEKSTTHNTKNDQIHAFQWELSTGIGIDRVAHDQYTFSNFKVRWAAVSNSVATKFTPPKQILNISFVNYLQGHKIVDFDSKESVALDFIGASFKTYGSVVRVWATRGTHIQDVELLVDRDNLQSAMSSNPELFARINTAEFLQILFEGIEQIVGPVSNIICLDVLVSPYLEIFKNSSIDLLLGTQQTTKYMKDISQDLAVDLVKCIVEGLIEAGVSGGTINAVKFFLGEVMSFAWIGEAIYIGGWDAATSKYYAEFQPPPLNCNLSIDVAPSGSQNKKVGESLTYTITVRDQEGNPVQGANVLVGDAILQSSQQVPTNSNGIATYKVQGSRSGSYTNTFGAAKAGCNSSPQVSRQLVFMEDCQITFSDMSVQNHKDSYKLNEKILCTVNMKGKGTCRVIYRWEIFKDNLRIKQKTIESRNMADGTLSFNSDNDGFIIPTNETGYFSIKFTVMSPIDTHEFGDTRVYVVGP